MSNYQPPYYGQYEGESNSQSYAQQNQPPMYSPPQYHPADGMEPPPGYMQRSRIAAGIFAILFGALGIHSFYLGNTSRGIIQLILTIFTFGIGAIITLIWGILDGVKLLDGRINTDAYGIYFKD